MNTTPILAAAPDSVWVGLDVSKEALDVCVLRSNGKTDHKQFAHDLASYTKLIRWGEASAPNVVAHFCLEATGSYSTAIALFLAEAEHKVSLVPPARIRFFALAQRPGNQPDKADARIIARFCCKEAPEVGRVATPQMRLLAACVRRLHAVQALLAQEKARLTAPSQPAAVIVSGQATVPFLDAEVARLRQQIRDHLAQYPELQRDVHLVQSIPGIGETPAWTILVELPDIGQFDTAPAVAAYAGGSTTRASRW